MNEISWKDIALLAAGLGTGVVADVMDQKRKERAKKEGGPGGVEIGSIAGALSGVASLAFDSREILAFGGGAGAGMALHDLATQYKRNQPAFRPMKIMGEESLVKRWTRIIEIDPSMSDEQKEALILPLLRDLAAQASPDVVFLKNPDYELPGEVRQELQKACEFLSQALGIRPGNPVDLIKAQRFFHFEGVMKGGYEAEESMTSKDPTLRRPDVDRFRLLSLLLQVYEKDGVLRFDCDDWGLGCNSLSFYNGIPGYFGVISQHRDQNLHHVFPISMLRSGELWGLEGIKVVPPFPISRAAEIYQPLTRFVLIYPDGSYQDQQVRGMGGYR